MRTHMAYCVCFTIFIRFDITILLALVQAYRQQNTPIYWSVCLVVYLMLIHILATTGNLRINREGIFLLNTFQFLLRGGGSSCCEWTEGLTCVTQYKATWPATYHLSANGEKQTLLCNQIIIKLCCDALLLTWLVGCKALTSYHQDNNKPPL